MIIPLKTTDFFLVGGRIDDSELGTRYLLDAMVALADGVVDKKKLGRVRAEEFKTQEGARQEGNWTGHGPLGGPGL